MSIRSSATYSGNAVNGRKLYVMPEMTATGLARTLKFCGTSPRFLSGPSRRPSSPRMNFHCTVRITNVTKNGTRIMKNSVDFQRPP